MSQLVLATELCACQKVEVVGEGIDTIVIAGDVYYVEWLLTEDFSHDDWTRDWVLETTRADVEVRNNKLFMTDYGIGSTLWYKNEFPKNIIVTYIARSEKGMEDNKLNFNTISHAKGNDGSLLEIGEKAGRTGAYVQYQQFTNYIYTLTFKHSRMRKDPGFNLLSDSAVRSEENKLYEVVNTVQDGRLRYYLNQEKIHDHQDSMPLEGGKFGLRTWNTKGSWSNIKIGRIIANPSNNTNL